MLELTAADALAVAVMGYLLGSIPAGVILARVMGLGDLRKIGSGNIGATNVLRTGNKKAAILTLLLDGLKGTAAVLIGKAIAETGGAQVAALAVFLGHCFPVWLGFRGGKGVATWFGIIFALNFVTGLIAAAIWIGVAAISRYSSLAALMAAGWIPIVMAFTGVREYVFLAMLLGALIYLRHGANIGRLRAGTETKIGKTSGSAPEKP